MMTTPRQSKPLPRLENGDRLTRAEFERRYAGMPNVKAELIEGVVYMAAALRYRRHGNPHSHILGWLELYAAYTPGVESADNATVRLDLDNEPQPDALLRLDEQYGGQSTISEDDYVEGAPELIVEIAASTASYDLHDKLRAYRRNGVREYLVWLVEDQEFRWYCLQDGAYILQEPNPDGQLCSQCFPGLCLVVDALLAGQMAIALETQQEALKSAEHQQFVAQLEAMAPSA
ncbi:MAG: Uma2 family endonuclease [Leptolyngbyaceae cyanobacterium]